MLLVALSCLQGRLQEEAFRTLVALEPDGVQLTPGNLPTPGFRARVEEARLPLRFHQGFAWEAYRAPVYAGPALVHAPRGSESLHPPRSGACRFDDWLAEARRHDLLVETMYPGYHLGGGAELDTAMAAGLRLVVDVSHLHIQRERAVLDDAALARLLRYDRVEEIHISDNDGRADQHRPLSPHTWMLGWALERARGGVPLVYESYLHRLADDDRRRQLDLVRH